MPSIETICEKIPRRTFAVRMRSSDDLPALPGGRPFAAIGFAFDPAMRRAHVERLLDQLDEAGAHCGIEIGGPGADAWEQDPTYLASLPWRRSPATALEQDFAACWYPFHVTTFHVFGFDADEPDWCELVSCTRQEVDRTIDERLHHAAGNGELEKVRRAIRDGWPVDEESRDLCWTPLHHAVHHGQQESLRLLLEAGAAVDAGHAEYRTALHMAIEDRNIEATRTLLAFGANPELRDDWGRTAIQLAEGSDARAQEILALLRARG